MNEENEEATGVNEEHVDCSDAFNTSQVIMCVGSSGLRIIKKGGLNQLLMCLD